MRWPRRALGRGKRRPWRFAVAAVPVLLSIAIGNLRKSPLPADQRSRVRLQVQVLLGWPKLSGC